MEVIETPIKDCFILKNQVLGDERGFFLEAFNQRELVRLGIDFEVKQVNFAKSQQNVLRGLHYQKHPYGQTKIVGVISGAILDVVVDLRRGSPTFGEYYTLKIEDQATSLLIPKGLAHGYYTFADDTVFYYAVDNFYAPGHETGLRYDDPDLKINWQLSQTPIISQKDLQQPLFHQIKYE